MTSFRVVTCNIAGWIMEGKNSWNQRAILNAGVLRQTQPDIIGFQELHETNVVDYRRFLPGFAFTLGLDEGNGMRPNTVACSRSRFQMIDQGGFWLSETGTMTRSWDTDIVRACSWVRLYDLQEKCDLLHINTHLDHIGETARVEGTKIIVDFLSQQPTDLPIVLTGDFNCSPHKPHEGGKYSRIPYDLLCEAGLLDAWMAANGEPPPNTFHGFKGEGYVADEYATWYIDWIMVRHLQVLSASIIKDAKPPLYPSDHYPIAAQLEYRPPL